MKRSIILSSLLSSLLVASALVACASDPAPAGTFPGTIKQESSSDLANAQACDAETACPADLECLFVAAFNSDHPICVDGADICEALDCGQGACLILESYPGQVMCSGVDTTPGDDDDCSVSSDGTTVCPDEDGSGDGGSSEPGDPGQG